MPIEDYLELLDASARQIRADKTRTHFEASTWRNPAISSLPRPKLRPPWPSVKYQSGVMACNKICNNTILADAGT